MSNLSYKTYLDLSQDIKANIHKIPEIDLVVGIPRSGMIPAYMVGLALSKPVCSINEFLSGDFMNNTKVTERISFDSNIKKVLILDDSINTGNALNKVKSMVEKAGAHNLYNIKYGAVYYSNGTENLVDVALMKVPQPRMFQWNFLNHSNLSKAAFDIDGVLCVDPVPEQNDDGEKYVDFILNAKPLYIPKYRVAAIVTSRLEKYRTETEKWLKEHGVAYDKLYMLENVTAEERRRNGLHAKHKSKIYKRLYDTNLFIESDREQANQIAECTGKLCFCASTDELFGLERKNNFKIKHSKWFVLRRLLAALVPVRGLRRKIRGV